MTNQERLERLRQLRIERKPGAAFSSHYACLEWIDNVAPLLKYGDQRHYDSFQHNGQFVCMPLSGIPNYDASGRDD